LLETRRAALAFHARRVSLEAGARTGEVLLGAISAREAEAIDATFARIVGGAKETVGLGGRTDRVVQAEGGALL